jgi:hypothetical protein
MTDAKTKETAHSTTTYGISNNMNNAEKQFYEFPRHPVEQNTIIILLDCSWYGKRKNFKKEMEGYVNSNADRISYKN